MKKVFIAGGAGFIGSYLTKEFIDDGYKVYIYDKNIQYFYPLTKYSLHSMKYRHDFLLKGAEQIRGNTLDVNDLRRNLIRIAPEYVINLAALPLAVTAVKNTEEAYNSILTTSHNFMEIFRDNNFLEKYVHISSSMIYGDFQSNPNPESANKSPKEIYGSMKLASEYLVLGYSQRFNINTAIIRPSAVYGPTDNNQRVLQKFIEAAIEGGEIKVYNPSSNFLDFTYVKDIALGIKAVTLANTNSGDIFNVTRGEGRSLQEVINILMSKFDNLNVIVKDDTSGIYPKRGALDISHARAKANFSPEYDLEKGMNEYIEFLMGIKN
jgi:UDP-glucose 4-epimerase